MGHVAPNVPLERVKERLSLVKGALVECPLVRIGVMCAPGEISFCFIFAGLFD